MVSKDRGQGKEIPVGRHDQRGAIKGDEPDSAEGDGAEEGEGSGGNRQAVRDVPGK